MGNVPVKSPADFYALYVAGQQVISNARALLNVTIGASLVTQDATHRFVSDAEKTTWNSKAAGDHIHSGYARTPNVLTGANVFSNITVGNGIVTAVDTRALTAADIGAAASSHSHALSAITIDASKDWAKRFINNIGQLAVNPLYVEAGQDYLVFQDGSALPLFSLGLAGSRAVAEYGGNLRIWRYDDAGTTKEQALEINRYDGSVTLEALLANGAINVGTEYQIGGYPVLGPVLGQNTLQNTKVKSSSLVVDSAIDMNANNLTEVNSIDTGAVKIGGISVIDSERAIANVTSLNSTKIIFDQTMTGAANSGGARLTRGDRASLGGCILQLGNSNNPKFEIIDKDWTTVLWSLDNLGFRSLPQHAMLYAYKNADKTVPNTTITVVPFEVEVWDRGSAFTPSTGLYNTPISGMYLIIAQVMVEWMNDANNMEVWISRNGALISKTVQRSSGSGSLDAILVAVASLTAGDDIEVKIYHSNGGDRYVKGYVDRSFLMIYLLSA